MIKMIKIIKTIEINKIINLIKIFRIMIKKLYFLFGLQLVILLTIWKKSISNFYIIK